MRRRLLSLSLSLAVVLGLGWQLHRIHRTLETQVSLMTMQAHVLTLQSTTMRALIQRTIATETPLACTPVYVAAERP